MPPPPFPYQSIVEQLVEHRKRKGLSQLDCDRLTGWSDGYTAKVECGLRRLTLPGVAMWASALGCDIVLEYQQHVERPSNFDSDIPIMEEIARRGCLLKVKDSAVRCDRRTGEALNALKTIESAIHALRGGAAPDPQEQAEPTGI